ncbi:hypothetical protein [Pseudonocardia sp.]|uniref:hypothetical protein n=1 Tax=Pseudonocardia sp. TaxID=60912 RepID=UPI0026188243|nr:hypothetical protein [Pseudonocardia sp.]
MTAGFRFTGLDGHLAFVDRAVVEPMRRAGEAGRPLDHLAYGVVGQAFAVPATLAVTLAADSVGVLTEAASGFGERLRRTREVYTATERANTDLLGGPR